MMKKLTSIFIFLFIVGAVFLRAHSPSDIKVQFLSEENLLKLEIIHSVSNAQKHFVKEINIKLNDEDIIWQKLNQQNDKNSLQLQYYIIDASIGDKLTISADCNKFGKETIEYKIKDNEIKEK